MRLNILVVLYMKSIEESIAIQSILSAMEVKRELTDDVVVHVWNNSPEYYHGVSTKEVYWYEGNNTSLPIIYNTVANIVFSGAGEQLLMLSDDDTNYTNYNISEVISEIEAIIMNGSNDVCGVFVPKVYSNNTLVSPGGRVFFKGKRIGSISNGLSESKNFVAINSGVIISRDCWSRMDFLYNTVLNFYGTDTDFFVRYEKYFRYVYVLNQRIDHELSENLDESKDRTFFRWSDHIFATRVTFSDYNVPVSFVLWLYIAYLKIKLSYRYKCIKYLSI